MKQHIHLWRYLFALGLLLALLPVTAATPRLRVLSFNAMGQSRSTALPWAGRSTAMCLKLHQIGADIMGLQEVDSIQATDLSQGLPEYNLVDEKLPQGMPRTETNPIFYRKEAYRLIDHGTFWLSETPEEPSPCWDVPRRQSVCWAVLQSIQTGISFLVANTRFDSLTDMARQHSAVLIKNYLSKMTNNTPVILTASLDREDSDPFHTALLQRYLPMKDAWQATGKHKGGPATTNVLAPRQQRTDYVFTVESVKVRQAVVYPALGKGDQPLSDHDMLCVELAKK